ncbi:pyridoxine kinase [Dysgonomonas sp. PH5-45]|uniref:pyridoxal kinase n=1 Tax=unclassified Dysgonomonas TaxID=2630389 RepID=UPI00247691F2|nr:MULTISPECIES: pyridoxal kinase [unclassified Dysgonomonas]MDH6353962.1 pyridoxine kinase [Dysgonomonas sp. PH5-45]MDH6386864.1 pyridoxine kinase [Dysgonomonas sp. PH5-37]
MSSVRKNKIITIQSRVVNGYVGNNTSELAIQLHGLDPIAFPTVLYANHSGFQPIYGSAITKDMFEQLVKGIEVVNITDQAKYMISGYIGSADVMDSIKDFVERTKNKDKSKVYICDPVMGDRGRGLFVPEAIANKICECLVPISDIITPNQYELGFIVNKEIETIDDIKQSISKHSVLKDKSVVVTGCLLKDTPEGMIDTILVTDGAVERNRSPRVDIEMVGSGDLFTSTMTSQIARGETLSAAVSFASQTVYKAIVFATQRGKSEMNAECLLHALGLKKID